MTRKTVIGQNLDLLTAPTDKINFAAYTIERYNAIVEYKTSYYSFYLPVACALYMVSSSFLPHNTMHKRCLCCGAVSVRLYVCLSIRWLKISSDF